jgi:DNA repair exonuclease SbcCD ATPase subunit
MIFGRQESDPTFFPEAVLEEVDLPGAVATRVLSSEAQLTIRRQDGEEIELTRGITHDRNKVRIVRKTPTEAVHMTLATGLGSMTDEAAGFQRFLFEWLGWPLKKVTTFDGFDAYIYLENLAPLFYIEQTEGWTEIQARQVGRYAQQQIRELSVEYVLGALDTLDQKVNAQRAAALESGLRSTARALAERASGTFLKQGWAVDWSGNGSVKEIEARWSSRTLREALQRDADVDIPKLRGLANERLSTLRKALTEDPIDPSNTSAASSASQLVVDLKGRRHKLNSELRTLREQYADSEHLLESLVHRIRTATDVHRLKTTGVGRLAHLECPTCHRELDLNAFQLTQQTAAEVQAHIEALKRDRGLTRQTLDAIGATIRATEAQIATLDTEFNNAQRTLEDVSASVGPVREQIVRAAANLSAEERYIEKLDATAGEIDALQAAINTWLSDAKAAQAKGGGVTDIENRTAAFTSELGQYLLALGHSAAVSRGVSTLRIDQGQYEPYLGHRRLRTLGSGSDPARLVAAYTLALAATSAKLNGLHPGAVILDEPLQQNPDADHIKLFLDFLSNNLAKEAKFQTIIFTFLNDSQVQGLRDSGTKVATLSGHLLGPTSAPPEHSPA